MNRPFRGKPFVCNAFAARAAMAVALFAAVSVSARADSRTREETVERVIGIAAGAVLNGDLENPGRTARSVTLEELDRILRERSRRRRAPQRRDPERRQPERYSELVMPVVGVEPHDLRDSYGDPRSGGRRHQGVDIFAPRWTEIVAVTRGRIDSIANGGLGGRTIWLRGDDGRAYYYAHLQQWADGLRRGMRVIPGQLIGFVGNSGNARTTATHLHFEVRDGGRATNPYYVLADARPVNGSSDRVTLAENRSIWQRIFGR